MYLRLPRLASLSKFPFSPMHSLRELGHKPGRDRTLTTLLYLSNRWNPCDPHVSDTERYLRQAFRISITILCSPNCLHTVCFHSSAESQPQYCKWKRRDASVLIVSSKHLSTLNIALVDGRSRHYSMLVKIIIFRSVAKQSQTHHNTDGNSTRSSTGYHPRPVKHHLYVPRGTACPELRYRILRGIFRQLQIHRQHI